MSIKSLQIAYLFDIPVFGGHKHELLKMVQNRLQRRTFSGHLTVFTPNAEQLVQSLDDDSFRRLLMQSWVNVPDGMSVVLATRLLSRETKISERISGVDLMQDLIAMAAAEQWGVLLVGGKGEVAKKAAQVFRNTYPGLSIWAIEGACDIAQETEHEWQEVFELVSMHKPKLVFVGFGAPWQERWVSQHQKALKEAGVRLSMVVGGAFDMISGKVSRAPLAMRRVGLEWLWRLIQEPWRWRRQLALFRFWGRVIMRRLYV